MTVERQGKKMTRTSLDEEGLKDEVESVARAEDIIDASPAFSGAVYLEAKIVSGCERWP